jgi:hypothetical protein
MADLSERLGLTFSASSSAGLIRDRTALCGFQIKGAFGILKRSATKSKADGNQKLEVH